MSDVLSYENLAAQLNTKFGLLDADEPFEIELVEITEATVTENQTFFAAYFLGDKRFMLPQATYRLSHAALGETLIFLVPRTRETDGSYRYEAVFNLLNEAK